MSIPKLIGDGNFDWSGDFEAPGHGSYIIMQDGVELEPGDVCLLLQRMGTLVADAVIIATNEPTWVTSDSYDAQVDLRQRIAEKLLGLWHHPLSKPQPQGGE